MLKIVHVFSDTTFISEYEHFNYPYIANTILIIGPGPKGCLDSVPAPAIISNIKNELQKILKICSESDLTILYEMDYSKSQLAIMIPCNVIVAWRFFGAELYDLRPELYLSELSLKFLRKKSEQLRKLTDPKAIIRKLHDLTSIRSQRNNTFFKAIKRVNLLLGLSEYEYSHLISIWKQLPPFLQLPVNYKRNELRLREKKDIIIIGNSRSSYNNHLDIIELINNNPAKGEYRYMVPFSYGIENSYTREVRNLIRGSHKQYILIDELLDSKSYSDLLASAKAAVFNTYRQMAMGNISFCIGSGVKVYLNKNNVIFNWLKDTGLKVFTIEDFAQDFYLGRMQLSSEDIDCNIQTFDKLAKIYNQEDFINKIIMYFKGNKNS